MIPYGRQDISDADVQAVVEVLRSDFITQGPALTRFEAAVAGRCGCARAVAVNSATAALHLACLALGLGPGDRLWTSPNTFVASANCALYCGAEVDFVDIDPGTYNLSPAALATKLERAAAEDRLPKIVMPVHFAGQPCDMVAIHALSQRYGFRVIEDASHAIGGRYQGAPIGDCRFSDITVFSFHPVKIITTGEGGMALTNNAELADHMGRLRSHGVTRDPALMVGDAEEGWYYQQVELGFNYRMTDIQAALGLSQLARLDDFVQRRHALAARYDGALEDLPLRLPYRAPDSYSALHLYPICIEEQVAGVSRRWLFQRLRHAGIGVNVHYIPVHTQPFFAAKGFARGDFPVAEAYYAGVISLPMFPTMTEAEQDKVIGTLRELLG